MMVSSMFQMFILLFTFAIQVNRVQACETTQQSIFYQKKDNFESAQNEICTLPYKTKIIVYSIIECLLICGRTKTTNAFIRNSDNGQKKCICTNKACFKTKYTGYSKILNGGIDQPDSTIQNASPVTTAALLTSLVTTTSASREITTTTKLTPTTTSYLTTATFATIMPDSTTISTKSSTTTSAIATRSSSTSLATTTAASQEITTTSKLTPTATSSLTTATFAKTMPDSTTISTESSSTTSAIAARSSSTPIVSTVAVDQEKATTTALTPTAATPTTTIPDSTTTITESPSTTPAIATILTTTTPTTTLPLTFPSVHIITTHFTRFSPNHGKTHSLIYHNVKCPTDKALVGFRLQENDHGQLRYEYDCVEIPSQCIVYSKSNPTQDNANGKIIFLDRLRVSCDSNDFMLSHQYRRSGRQSWYNFNCCHMQNQNQLQCSNLDTSLTQLPSPGTQTNLQMLTGQDVTCPTGSIISSFRLTRYPAQGSQLRYKIKCCSLANY
ncbi:uncharacterized protein [Clytia hemisphaerica]|uniref:Cnidarian restricted protein n=1 Tax=Clytia hemisphaerica TaxID=252671 RepID=A0A7M6DN91_9CNID